MQVTTQIFGSLWAVPNISVQFSSQGCLICVGFSSTILESLCSCSYDCVRNGVRQLLSWFMQHFLLQSILCFCAFCVLGLVPCYLSGDSTWRPLENNSCCGIWWSTYLTTYLPFFLYFHLLQYLVVTSLKIHSFQPPKLNWVFNFSRHALTLL